jgi:cytochrome c-type biogenesis protein CcmH/NrfG
LYVQQRRFAEAAECFRKVLALEPQSPLARAALEAIDRTQR